jgi:peptidoglycan/xylan/chitin deacetylase (PgdA/CDA1 family)
VTPPGPTVDRRPVLVRQSTIGEFDAPAPRPALTRDPVLHWARWGLMPFSSVMRVRTDDPVIALTYDDGPEPSETLDLLDLLAERGRRATFFVLSDRVEAHPEIVTRMLRDGHEVELHGIDHADLTTVPGRVASRRIREARRRVEAVTGRPVRFYRPTYGAVSIPAFIGTRLSGMDVVIWSAWAQDWFDAPPQEVADRAVRALHPGAILLLHDTTDQAQSSDSRRRPTFSRADVAGRILDGADAAGFTTVPVGELLDRYPAVRSLTVRRPRIPFR